MGETSAIEWTGATWNPVRGCTKISQGCKNCYANTFAERWRGIPGHAYEQGFDLRLAPNALTLPLRWTKPRPIFVNSMSDLFHVQIPMAYVATVFEVMWQAYWHVYQVLTKRASLLAIAAEPFYQRYGERLRHVWLGVSVEDRNSLHRIDALRATSAPVRFLSIEPLLEDLGELDLSGISWVIVGGESGPGARFMEAAWVRSIQRQCEEQGVHFFFKQWGGIRKKINGRELDGQTFDAMPEFNAFERVGNKRRQEALSVFEKVARTWSHAPMARVEYTREAQELWEARQLLQGMVYGPF